MRQTRYTERQWAIEISKLHRVDLSLTSRGRNNTRITKREYVMILGWTKDTFLYHKTDEWYSFLFRRHTTPHGKEAWRNKNYVKLGNTRGLLKHLRSKII